MKGRELKIPHLIYLRNNLKFRLISLALKI